MGLSVSGFVSGLDVPTVVSQLMTSESYPKTLLQSQLSDVQTQASAYRAINTKVAALLTAAQDMTSTLTWSSTTASSSASTVAATSDGTAAAQSLTFDVVQTASAQTSLSARSWTATTDSYGLSSPVTVYGADGRTVEGTISVGGSGTLADAVSAINGSGLGLRATAVQTTNGYRLQVGSTSTGAANGFTLGSATDFPSITTAADAQVHVGTATNGYTVSSATNTFTGLMSGVTLSVSQPATNVTVSVVADPDAVTKKMQTFVDAANAVLSSIATQTATGLSSTGTAAGTAGPLAGDFTMQSLASKVRSLVSSVVATTTTTTGTSGTTTTTTPLGSPAKVGVHLESDGTITFEADTFTSALKSDPALVKKMVSGDSTDPGIARRLQDLAKQSTDSMTGTLTTLAAGLDSRAKDLQSQIDDWTARLTARQAALTTQYTNLQTALSSLQNQQSWLSSMFDQLGGSSSSSSSS